jgi:SAM-dependent methyltransferase
MTQSPLYDPNFTEKSRQDFVLSLKRLTNGVAQQRVREAWRRELLPALRAAQGAEPTQRAQVEGTLARSLAFRQWAVLTHHSQSMMWAAIEPTARRLEPEANRRYAALRAGRTLGSLELDPALPVPQPISDTEIHRQPEGYVGRSQGEDIAPGLRYLGAAMIYSVGKGREHAATDGRGRLLLEEIERRRPGFRPRRILDLGCGIGVHAQPIALAHPQAEYHAIDVAAGLLRYAHLAAEERGVAIHFHQRDAAATGFADGSFDLVISNIMFHETNREHLPRILRECRRVLAPGGLMVHADVPTQVSRLGLEDQVMNAWQDRWNGEPFWSQFAAEDMRARLIEAGFAPQSVFAEHVQGGGGVSYVFGAG